MYLKNQKSLKSWGSFFDWPVEFRENIFPRLTGMCEPQRRQHPDRFKNFACGRCYKAFYEDGKSTSTLYWSKNGSFLKQKQYIFIQNRIVLHFCSSEEPLFYFLIGEKCNKLENITILNIQPVEDFPESFGIIFYETILNQYSINTLDF